jgi:hypothetical protein
MKTYEGKPLIWYGAIGGGVIAVVIFVLGFVITGFAP